MIGRLRGSPRFLLRGSFKGDMGRGIDIDVDMDIDFEALWRLSKSA